MSDESLQSGDISIASGGGRRGGRENWGTRGGGGLF